MESKADQIRTLRNEGLTVREIAEQVGCSFQYVHQIVRVAAGPKVQVRVRGEEVVVTSGDLPTDVLAIRVERALGRIARRRED